MLSHNKPQKLYLLLGCFFITNALLAEFVGVKIFSLEQSLGIAPVNWSIIAGQTFSFNLTAGVILWPLVFVITDIVNEYYGKAGVRLLSFMAAGLILYAFLMITFTIGLEPATFWKENPEINMDLAFNKVFTQGNWIIVGSLVAFLIGQLVDVYVFQWLRRIASARYLWLRAVGSTLVSQLIDSFVVLFIAFYIGNNWPLELVIAIGLMNYIYKFIVAIALTPLLYLMHALIDRYLGKPFADQLILQAASK